MLNQRKLNQAQVIEIQSRLNQVTEVSCPMCSASTHTLSEYAHHPVRYMREHLCAECRDAYTLRTWLKLQQCKLREIYSNVRLEWYLLTHKTEPLFEGYSDDIDDEDVDDEYVLVEGLCYGCREHQFATHVPRQHANDPVLCPLCEDNYTWVKCTCVHCDAVENQPILNTVFGEPAKREVTHTCVRCYMAMGRDDAWNYAIEDDLEFENPMGDVDDDDWPF